MAVDRGKQTLQMGTEIVVVTGDAGQRCAQALTGKYCSPSMQRLLAQGKVRQISSQLKSLHLQSCKSRSVTALKYSSQEILSS